MYCIFFVWDYTLSLCVDLGRAALLGGGTTLDHHTAIAFVIVTLPIILDTGGRSVEVLPREAQFTGQNAR